MRVATIIATGAERVELNMFRLRAHWRHRAHRRDVVLAAVEVIAEGLQVAARRDADVTAMVQFRTRGGSLACRRWVDENVVPVAIVRRDLAGFVRRNLIGNVIG